MRRFLNFKVGETVLIRGREHTFKGFRPSETGDIDEVDDLLFEDGIQRPVLLTLAKFNELNNTGQIKRIEPYERAGDRAPESDAPDIEKRRARQYLLQKFDDSGSRKSEVALREFLGDVAADFPFNKKFIPSPGHFIRLIRERGVRGDRRLRHMGDRYRSSGSSLNPAVRAILAAKAELYFSGHRKTPLDIWVLVYREVQRKNEELATQGLAPLKPPAKATVWRYLKEHETFERARSRNGAKHAEKIWEPIKGSMKADRILDLAIFDHTTIDCWVIDDETGIPVGRPHLGVLIDVCSRYPLGFYIGFEEPSLHSVMAALKCAIKSKEWINEAFPSIDGVWCAYGSPRSIALDNAWEGVGSSFVDACEDARISVQWAPVQRPQYKAIVERHFGTLNTKLWTKLPGGIPGKPQRLKEFGIDPEKEAAVLLSQLRAAYCQCVIEVYGREPVRTLGKSPEQIWREREPIDLIEMPSDVAGLEAAFGRVVDATLTREGIIIDGIPYHSPEVTRELLKDLIPFEPRRGRSKGSVKVKVKLHPDNLSVLHVLNHRRKQYVAMPCAHPRYVAGITEHHHKMLKAFARRENLEFNTEAQQVEARARLQDLMDSFTPVKIKHRRQQQRLKPRREGPEDVIAAALASKDQDPHRPHHEVVIDAISDRADGRDRFKSPVRRRRRPKRVPANDDSSASEASPQHQVASSDLVNDDEMAARIEAARLRVKERRNAG